MNDTDSPNTETDAQASDTQAADNETAADILATGVDPQLLRLLEAVLFASAEPMDAATLATRLPEGADVPALITQLTAIYANRGVNLVQAGGKWLFRTAEDLAPQMRVYANPQRKLSRAAIETLAIVAYHQPITRAEMEEIRGVGLSKGTIDMLFEQGWITPRGRRQTPGKPVTWGSTDKFLTDFGIESIESLPGLDELKATGLLDKRPAIQITDAALPVEEEPLSPEEAEKLAEDEALLASLEDEAAQTQGASSADQATDAPEASNGTDDDDDHDDDDEEEDEDEDEDGDSDHEEEGDEEEDDDDEEGDDDEDDDDDDIEADDIDDEARTAPETAEEDGEDDDTSTKTQRGRG